MKKPTPEEIKEARKRVGLTQIQAAKLVYVTLNGWQRWEQDERTMPLAKWELFLLKTKG